MKKGLGSIPKSLAWIDNDSADEVKKSQKVVVPKKLTRNPEEISASHAGLPYGWTRSTFIIQEEYSKKLKALAYWERTTIKDLMDNMLQNYFKKKKVKAIPKR